MKLGKIKKIDLRDVWASESSDFTPWLAKEENIAMLGDAIGMDLEVESQEKKLTKEFDFMDKSSREEQFLWSFVESVQKFIKYFKPKIKSI